jgi:hypothetical protein
LKPSELNKSEIGRDVQLDFGKPSNAISLIKKMTPETVTIKFRGKDRVFREHRVDDGFMNWFIDQYLETVKPIDGQLVRITKNKLLSFSPTEIRVEVFFEFYTPSGNPVVGKTFTEEHTFSTDNISYVLVKMDKQNR